MKRQRCIITLESGAVLVYEGVAQYDTDKPVKVRKVSFTRPHEVKTTPSPTGSTAGDELWERLMGVMEGKK